MKKLENWISKLNLTQKLIIAIAIPLLLFLLAAKIADIVSSEHYWNIRISNPYDLSQTWWVWLLFVIGVVVIELKLFENKKQQ